MAAQYEMEMNRLSPALLAAWLQGINHSDEDLPAKHHQPRLLPPRRAEVLAVQLMEEAGESCKFEAII